VQIVPTADRAAVGLMLGGLDGAIDLIIPEAARALSPGSRRRPVSPCSGTWKGSAIPTSTRALTRTEARAIVLNAKMRRVSVCGATETLLIDATVAPALLPLIADDLTAAGCALRGDKRACSLVPSMAEADEDDWRTEYLAPELAVRVVDGLDDAVAHIGTYGSGHTDAIVTEDAAAAEAFTRRVDSAIVLVNASTQFADGGEFGFGGEIGIATDKLHARGPVGAEQLTTFKYVVRGTGQTRP
jgi:glutamate-5-semialdehyde dehydrogenase